jgi:putative redox protein
MHFLSLTFENKDGKKLSARLDLPIDEKPTAYALFAHCFTCSKNLNAVVHINRALAMNGIAVLRFDFTGLGQSEGDFASTNLSTNVADLVAAADFLTSNFEAPKLLIGHSLGGAAALQAANRIPSCVAVATIAAPASPSDLGRMIRNTKKDILTRGEGEITLGGRTFRLKRQFLEDLEAVQMEKTVRSLNRALLVLHSPQDKVVDMENARAIFEVAQEPKSLVSLDQADHLLSSRRDSLYAGSVLAAWAKKYVEIVETSPPKRDLADNRVVVRTGKKGFQTEIIANEHRLIADEPIAAGGANTGPTPYEYLVAALGACTSMTLRIYADRKGWPVESIAVKLRHQKIHSRDCEDCEENTRKVDYIDREIELEGPLTKEQRERLLQIADRCPIHQTLLSDISISSKLTN